MSAIVHHTPDDKDRLVTALALVYENPDHAEAIAASYGFDSETLLELISTDPDSQRAALVRAEQLRQGGELLKRKTLEPLEKLVDQLGDMIDAGKISAAAAPKVAETLFKLSGLAEERAARLRTRAEDDAPKATIIFLSGNDPEPPPAKPNEHRLIVRIPGAKQRHDIIDVTPTEGEGGSDGA